MTGCSFPQNNNNSNPGYFRESFYFDTICNITIYGIHKDTTKLNNKSTEDEKNAICQDIISEAFSLCSSYEDMFSKTKEGSDIFRINHSAGEPTTVSEETIYLLETAISFGDLTNGLFDISIGKVSEVWGFPTTLTFEEQKASSIPSVDQLNEAVSHVNYKNIKINKEDNTVTLLDPNMLIDLGGIAKGYIADKVAEKLKSLGVVSAVINLGGNIQVIGGKSSDFIVDEKTSIDDFVIGINNPNDQENPLLTTVNVKDKTLVSSGTYQRYVEYDGVKYHHILNPKTGCPVETNLIQVTIIGPCGSSMISDILSTSCLLLGEEEGNILVEKINDSSDNKPFEVIYLDAK